MNFPHPPSSLFTPPPKFKALLEQQTKHPPLPLVANFIHQCSPDPSVRTNLVTQFVLSIWQLAGGRMSPRFPSLITISPPAKSPNLDGDFATLIMPETIKSLPVRALSQEEISQAEAHSALKVCCSKITNREHRAPYSKKLHAVAAALLYTSILDLSRMRATRSFFVSRTRTIGTSLEELRLPLQKP